MKILPEGRELIQKWESFEPNWYQCSAGVWTIGYGHAVFLKYREPQPGDLPLGLKAPLTLQQANNLLDLDIDEREKGVSRLVEATINRHQFSALVSFAFNVGLGQKGLAGSTLLKKVNEGDFEAAADEFDKWVYAGGNRLEGLERRRAAEKQLFLEQAENALAVKADNLHPMPILPPVLLDEGVCVDDPDTFPIRTVTK